MRRFFVYTHAKCKKILINEGISSKKIITTGNTIVDAVMQNIELSKKKSKILNKLGIQKNKYLLLTIHREENVDNRERLENFFASLKLIIKEYNQSIVYPIHPRTKKMIDLFNIEVPQGIMVIEPVGFIDFLQLEINSNLILTDSGGVQEEACILKVPCVTLRDNTERPETVTVGANILAGADVKNIMKCVSKMINKKRSWNNPFGNGRASEKIISVLSKINDSMK